MDPIALLKKNKTDILESLIGLSRDPKRAAELVQQLTQTESALVGMSPPVGKYAGYVKVRDALKDILETSGRPWAEEDLKTEIVDKGGFRRGKNAAAAKLIVQKSIKLHLHGDGAKTWPLKIVNGLIGPKEWPDELFKREK